MGLAIVAGHGTGLEAGHGTRHVAGLGAVLGLRNAQCAYI